MRNNKICETKDETIRFTETDNKAAEADASQTNNIDETNVRDKRLALSLLFSGNVLSYFLVIMSIAFICLIILSANGFLKQESMSLNLNTVLLWMGIGSLAVGIALSLFLVRFPLRSVNKIINAMNLLASGKFNTRLHFGRPFGNHPTMIEICESFNRLASELEKTEMLRTDFVNNFSHEFKTPIVSIAGFASLLRRGGLDVKEQTEYLAVIEEESRRLADMATNVMNLNRVENQTILSEVRRYNLSEQIRSCMLLLENRWSQKNITPLLDFGEIYLSANEELLKQVWLNILDNAIKFAPTGAEIDADIQTDAGCVSVTISNTGSEILPEQQDRIFQKFYQADESHSTKGNGIGLAVVRKIVELHKGTVSVRSEGGKTSFTVIIPDSKTLTNGISHTEKNTTKKKKRRKRANSKIAK